MAKTHEALLKAEKEHQMNYLEPIKREVKTLVPATPKGELIGPTPEWCKEIKARLNTQYPDKRVKSIMFTSTRSGSGCSRTAVGFALSLAKAFNHRVLLIDVNLKNPGVHKFFNGTDTCGLFDVSLNNHSLLDKNSRERLFVITCDGDYSEEVEGFLGSHRFEEFLQKMRKSFDYIILDGPPTISNPEVRFISSKVDGTILMLEAGKTRRNVALKAKRDIEMAGGRFIGVVLNRRKYYIPKWIYSRL
jgi:capsular exopolysaccharide synthesis family protein